MTWTAAQGAQVELTKSASGETIERDDLERLRNEQRRVATANGRGLVSAEIRTTRHGISVFEVVTKARSGMGHEYVGTVTCTDGAHTYTVRVAADEGGVTGLREAAVSVQALELGELQLPTAGVPGRPQPIPGWLGDPYDPSWDDDALNAVTDDERLDVVFPSHPLSRVRALLDQVRQSLMFDNHARESRPPLADLSAVEMGRAGPRCLLSDTVVRELQWKHECFDAIAAALRDTLAALEGPGASRDERVAEHLLLLGITQARQESHVAAVTSLARARNIYRDVCGGDHVKTAVATAHLARAHLDVGSLGVAAPLFMEALEVLEEALPNHLVLGMTLSGYGRLLIAQHSAEALPYVMRSRSIAEALGGGKRFFLLQETAGAAAPAVRTPL